MNSNTCILPLSYWGNIQYFSKFICFDEVIIELFENYPKKTYRNRSELYGANGMLSIQVPVERGSFHRTNIQDLKISYDISWQKNHLRTIQSAYKSSPFYEYYEDDIIPLYDTRYKFLKDLNIKILEICMEWLSLTTEIHYSGKFIEKVNPNDYRDLMHPKVDVSNDSEFINNSYIQGFEQRHGFIKNLSILDLIFNVGPESYQILKNSSPSS